MTITFLSTDQVVSRVMCDKISIVTSLPELADYQSVYDQLGLLVADNLYGHKKVNPVYGCSRQLYVDQNWNLPSYLRRKMMFQMKESALEKHPVRLEFNPTLDDMGMVRTYVTYITGMEWESVMENAKVTRIDIAVDLEEADLADFAFDCKYAQKTSCYCNHGVLETIYFGSGESQLHLCIYDKSKELDKKGHGGELIRIEARCRSKPPTPLTELAKIPCPFDRLEIKDLRNLKLGASEIERLALELARFKGLKRALSDCGATTAKSLAKRLSSHKCAWWDAGAIWEGWDKVVEAIQNPPPVIDFIN
ncbi:MAG: phage/plasmid replication protein [Porticoccus sp.]